MNNKFSLIVVLFFYLFVKLYSQSENSISASNLLNTVEFLSSWELKGRLSGSEGYNKAAEFIFGEFAKLNLKPITNNNYLQNLKVEYNEINAPVKLALHKNDQLKVYKLGTDYVFRGFTGSNHIAAPIAFCGYGFSKPEIGYDDYSGIDVKGKVVMAFKYNPPWKLNDTTNWGEGSIRYKIKTAYDHGAKGIMFVSFPNDQQPQKPILSILDGEGEQILDIPSLHIDIPVADEFLSGTGYRLKDLQTKIDSMKKPFSILCNYKAEIEVHAKYFKEKETMNVVGILEGSDPDLKNEFVVIGAHLDHVGSQADEIYAPGANDNASGSAAVLEIARTFVKNNIKPKRSVIFVLFASEELGLFGAKYFVENSPVPLGKITAMINMDCIGYGDSIKIGNGKSAPVLWNLIRNIDSLSANMMVKETWNGGGADAAPFHEKGIPCAYFVTTNSYEHLHLPSDKPETLNKVLYEKIARLAFLSVYEIANGNYKRETVK